MSSTPENAITVESPSPKKTNFFAWIKANSNGILAISALLISLSALVVSIVEMRTMQVQQKAMVYPHLDVGESYSSEGFTIYAKNTGTGLAVVKSVEVSLDDKPFESWMDIINYILPEGHSVGYNIVSVGAINGKVIPASEVIKVFGVDWTDESRVLVNRLISLKYRICYCSLLDDCWEISSKESFPQPTEPCEFNEEVRF
ncbi:MAG: hypothetical protein AAGJ93_04560 [Bacteroidota bacterium]